MYTFNTAFAGQRTRPGGYSGMQQNYPHQVDPAASGEANPVIIAPNELYVFPLGVQPDQSHKLRMREPFVIPINKAGDRVVLPDGSTYSPPAIQVLDALSIEILAPSGSPVVQDLFAAYNDRSERGYHGFFWDARGTKGRTTVDLIHPSGGVDNPRYILVLGLSTAENTAPGENVPPSAN